MTLVYVLLAIAAAATTGVTMYFVGRGRHKPVVTAPAPRSDVNAEDVAKALSRQWRDVIDTLFAQVKSLEEGLSTQNDIIAETQQSMFKLYAQATHPPLPPPAPAPVELPIDMKSLLELTHTQQISMISMVAQVVKDISQHAAATVTAPLMAQLNRPAPPQGPMSSPVPWYGREDVAVIDGADPFDKYMNGNPYYQQPGPSAGYVPPSDEEPFGIPGMKWPEFAEGMVKPQMGQ